MLTQPAKSPDLNVLDLSFFRALQSAQWKERFATTIDGLIDQVLRAYREFDPMKISKGYLTLQSCMDEILNHHGSNDYKVPHIGKDAMIREHGRLPASIHLSERAKEVYLFVIEGRPILHPRGAVAGIENGNENNNDDTAGQESDAND